jgi:hypothetical protein
MLQGRGLRTELLHAPESEPPSAFMSLLSAAGSRSIVRITGGCADMSRADADRLDDLFRGAFLGFSGAILIGGTRMMTTEDPAELIPGITEVGPLIRQDNPDSVLLGVVPRSESLSWDFNTGALLVQRSQFTTPGSNGTEEFRTIVQPHMDAAVVLGKRITKQSIWHDEAVFCARVTEAQRLYAKWDSALVVYNGGSTTEYEVELFAKQRWPVILIAGSGRTADKLANDSQFLSSSPSVIVCNSDTTSLRGALVQAGTMPSPQKGGLRVVS